MPSARDLRVQPDSAIKHAEKRVEDQISVVEKLKAEGRETIMAERLLETYREVLDALNG
jgi:hypothetical protein